MYKFLTFYKKSSLTNIYDVGLTSDFRCVWPTIQAVKKDHDRRNIDTSGVFSLDFPSALHFLKFCAIRRSIRTYRGRP